MNNNVFIKSVLRQHIRSAILVLLIAVAAFLFVMRTVEYFIVTEQIETIGSYYRSIGFLQVAEGTDALENVSAGAEIVHSSPYTTIDDKRRDIAGYVQGLLNADIRGIDQANGVLCRA